jgi:hypothetical protein
MMSAIFVIVQFAWPWSIVERNFDITIKNGHGLYPLAVLKNANFLCFKGGDITFV